MTLQMYKMLKRRHWCNMIAKSWRLRSSEILLMWRQTEFTVSKIENTNWKCRWKKEKKKSKSIKISLSPNPKPLRTKDTKLQLSCNTEKQESRTCVSSMKD